MSGPDTSSADLSILAWNGVRFSFPHAWEVTGIRNSYVLLEDGDGPTLDLRWERSTDGTDAETALARLRKQSRKTGLIIDDPSRLPVEPSSLTRPGDPAVKAVAFSWSTGEDSTPRTGCLLRFPASSMTVVARFHRNHSRPDLIAAAKLASSLVAFSPSRTVPWQLYDIRFKLPGSFALESFSLQPGHYRFIFRSGDSRLIIDRVGPASVLLKSTSLEGWVSRFHSLEKTKSHEIRNSSGDAGPIEWIARRTGDPVPCGGGLSRLLRPLRYCRGRAWIPRDANMLLSVTMTCKKPPDDTFFTEVCSSYGLV